jgi:hypothetical protein
MNPAPCFSLALLLLLIVVPGRSEAQDVVPRKLDIYFGTPVFGASRIVLHEHSLVVTQQRAGFPDQIAPPVTPTKEQWDAFREALDSLGAPRWQADYPNNRRVFDGTQWHVEIEYADHTLKARGDNNFPDAEGKPKPGAHWTPTFQAFVNAVKRLLGKDRLFPDVGEQPRQRPNQTIQLRATRRMFYIPMSDTLPPQLTLGVGSRS